MKLGAIVSVLFPAFRPIPRLPHELCFEIHVRPERCGGLGVGGFLGVLRLHVGNVDGSSMEGAGDREFGTDPEKAGSDVVRCVSQILVPGDSRACDSRDCYRDWTGGPRRVEDATAQALTALTRCLRDRVEKKIGLGAKAGVCEVSVTKGGTNCSSRLVILHEFHSHPEDLASAQWKCQSQAQATPANRSSMGWSPAVACDLFRVVANELRGITVNGRVLKRGTEKRQLKG